MTETLPPFDSGSIDDCRFPATVAVGEYWKSCAKTADGDTPLYRAVDLMDLYKVAPLLTIKDVVGEGEDFVVRYWGTELRRALGFEGTGMRIGELEPPEMSRNLMERYRRMLQTQQPESRRAQIEHLEHRKFVTYEVLHVPWLDDAGSRVSQIMTVYQFNIPLEPKSAI
ncbi:MAG: PAS domain-containing protein [Rhodospirillales bacterium]|nr:PAS domain-containing protein [Rhodospirillales bacterium]